MEAKNIIREKRLELGLTYEELGKIVGVGKSTVRKWETGMIENIKRDNIVALAKALKVSPALIMGWDVEENKQQMKAFAEKWNLEFNEKKLVENYRKLNDLGKKEANKRVSELAEMARYTFTEPLTVAAHDDDLTPEEKDLAFNKALDVIKKNRK